MSKPFVLIIEDDPKVAGIYQMTLQRAGFDTILDMSGNKFSALSFPASPALIILDLHMPFASGVDILHQIRADHRLAGAPVIITTADLVLVKSLRDQVEAILIKPVSVARLRETALHFHPLKIQNK